MSLKTVEDSIKRLRKAGVCYFWQVKGFSVKEVNRLQFQTGLQLPSIYVDFLRAMGRGAGRFAKGADLFFRNVDDLVDFQDLSREPILESGYPLSDDSFIFGGNQGYVYSFFHTDGNSEDPAVYQWLEEEYGYSISEFKSFSEWLERAVTSQIKIEGLK